MTDPDTSLAAAAVAPATAGPETALIDDETFRSMCSAALRTADEVGCNSASLYQAAARTITRLERHLRRHRTAVATLEARTTELDGDLANLQTRLDIADAQNGALEARLRDAELEQAKFGRRVALLTIRSCERAEGFDEDASDWSVDVKAIVAEALATRAAPRSETAP